MLKISPFSPLRCVWDHEVMLFMPQRACLLCHWVMTTIMSLSFMYNEHLCHCTLMKIYPGLTRVTKFVLYLVIIMFLQIKQITRFPWTKYNVTVLHCFPADFLSLIFVLHILRTMLGKQLMFNCLYWQAHLMSLGSHTGYISVAQQV